MPANVIIRPNHGAQTLALSCPIPDMLYGGARGGGKGIFLLLDWLRHAERCGGKARGLLIRKYLSDLTDWIKESHKYLPQLGWVWRESDKEWRGPKGDVLSLRYLEHERDADRNQGWNLSWLAIDEAGQYATPAAIDLLYATLRNPDCPEHLLRLTANPGGPGHTWLKERYVTPADPMRPFKVTVPMPDGATLTQTRVYIPARLRDNPHCDTPEYRAKLALSGPPWLVAAWLNGDWDIVAGGGLIDVDQIKRGPLPRLDFIVQGWDTAFTEKTTGDESAGAAMGRDEQGRFWIADMRHGRWHPGDVSRQIIQFRKDWRASAVSCEGGGAGLSVDHLIKDYQQQEGAFFDWSLISHMRDKIAKNATITGLINSGQVWVPDDAPWWPWISRQLLTFSGKDGIPDDGVDALGVCSRRLDEMMSSRPPAPEPPPKPDYERRGPVRAVENHGPFRSSRQMGESLFGGRRRID